MRSFVHNVGLSSFGPSNGNWLNIVRQALQAAQLWQEGGPKQPIDALVLASQEASGLVQEGLIQAKLAHELSLPQLKTLQWINSGSASGAAALEQARFLLYHPRIQRVLVVAFEVMPARTEGGIDITEAISRVLHRSERAWSMSMLQGAALVAQRLLATGEMEAEDWHRIAWKNHNNARANPVAQFRKEIALDKIRKSRYISTPLRLFHCAPISDGAAVLLLGQEESPIELAAVASGHDRVPLQERLDFSGFAASQQAARRAYEEAGIGPEQIQVAEIHDAFAPFEMMGLRDLQLASNFDDMRRKALAGYYDPHGALPINASGGLKARGHPVGASGLAQVVELTAFLRGESFCDYSDKRYAAALSIGGLASLNYVTLLKNHNSRGL